MFRRPAAGERGFTLVETLAALTIFAVMTVGITPLLIASIRGTALAKSHTVGKNLVSEAMERVRGLPYYDASPNRDVLDSYFPNLGNGYVAADNTFTTKCTSTTSEPSGSGPRACPSRHADGTSRIPPGYELTFATTFVKPAGLNPETFTVVSPAATYDSATEATSLPPTQLIKMTITALWNEMGKVRQFSLSSLVGERRLSSLKASAEGNVDHVFSVSTAYKDSAGVVSGMTGTGGVLSSKIEIKAMATAFANASAGSLVLSKQQTDTEPGTQLAAIDGARATMRAPVNVVPAPTVYGAEGSVNHPGLLGEKIGYLGPTVVNDDSPAAGVQVVTGFPRSATNLGYTGGVGDLFWANNEPETGELSAKKFDATKPMFAMVRPSGPLPLLADTYAEATPESPPSSRKVEATAKGSAPRFVLLPILGASGPGGTVVIDDFTATLNCKSTGSSAGAVALGSWSAELKYWRDSDPSDNVALGAYASVTLSGSTDPSSPLRLSSDPLAALRTENPLVYDALLPADDVYLFSDPAAGKRGYLESWASTFAVDSSKSDDVASVDMPYAINIVTSRTNSLNEESKFTVSIGKLSCRAEDYRA